METTPTSDKSILTIEARLELLQRVTLDAKDESRLAQKECQEGQKRLEQKVDGLTAKTEALVAALARESAARAHADSLAEIEHKALVERVTLWEQLSRTGAGKIGISACLLTAGGLLLKLAEAIPTLLQIVGGQ